MATKDPAGQLAPPSGFQTGGWYSGYQYWDGTFAPSAGMIHPNSNQQGSGQMVSPEVNQAESIRQGNDPNANQQWIDLQNNTNNNPGSVNPNSNANSGASGLGNMLGSGSGVTSSLNLMDEQKKLYDASGITQLQTTIAGIQATIDNNKAEADKRRSEVNENPFLSESSRVGRIRKIDEALNDTNQTEEAKLANYQNSINAKQNEINEKLGLQVKQFDIDKATRAENMDLFNTLLSSGALSNATAQDLGNLSAQTGLPLSFIQSAIKTSLKADVQIETQTDNAGNVTILTINKQTGEIINQVSAGKVGKGQTGNTTKANQEMYKLEIQALAAGGYVLEDLFGTYIALGVDPNDIYNIYNSSTTFGVADPTFWTPERLRQYGVVVPATKSTKTTEIDPKTGTIKITE